MAPVSPLQTSRRRRSRPDLDGGASTAPPATSPTSPPSKPSSRDNISSRSRSSALRALAAQPAAAQRADRRNVAALLAGAGLGEAIGTYIAEVGLDPAQAKLIGRTLLEKPPTVANYGPRLLAIAVARGVIRGGKALAPDALARFVGRFRGLLVVRPDGVIADLVSGRAIQRSGTPKLSGKRLVAGDLDVGGVYASRAGLLYDVRADLSPRKDRPARAELAFDKGVLGATLDGVGDAIKDVVEGVARLIKHPIRSVVDLAQLPSTISELIYSAPQAWQRFKTLPRSEQIRVVSRLATHVVSSAVGVAGAGAAVAKAGTLGNVTLRFPQMLQAVSGELAVAAAVVVPAGRIAAAASAGTSAALLLNMQSSMLQKDPRISRETKVSMGRLRKLMTKDGHGELDGLVYANAYVKGKGNAIERARGLLAKLKDDASQSEKMRSLAKGAYNAIADLDDKHLVAVVRDRLGDPVKIAGKVFDHEQEVRNKLVALRSFSKAARELAGAARIDAVTASRLRSLANTMDEFLLAAGKLWSVR
ncbi:MAG: hypothetical protein KC503_06800 [Myxococcales bacterium]|nr:hypothetical protein [Myxococcales bacterium]